MLENWSLRASACARQTPLLEPRVEVSEPFFGDVSGAIEACDTNYRGESSLEPVFGQIEGDETK